MRPACAKRADVRRRRDGADLPSGQFDAILADVPCSNTGVLGKRAEARWRVSANDIAELNEVQKQLLKTAMSRTVSGGRMVYSTCSIEPEENRAIVDAILQETPGWSLVEEVHHSPGNPADGGYQALLRRE